MSSIAEDKYGPQLGSPAMPRWEVDELIDAPRFTWKNWFSLLGPGLLMGGAAIGGGEWLLGPATTAKYGGALMWLATLSIVAQVFYNIEISRYTLYTGEPIFTGKFRTMPGPKFWLMAYVFLDFGSVFPYLAQNAATPLVAIGMGRVPGKEDELLLRAVGMGVFLLSLLPMIFGGKIYNTLKWIMSFKIVAVFSFLLLIAFAFSTWSTWREILTGFVSFGTVPVDASKSWNHETTLNLFSEWWAGRPLPTFDLSMIGLLAAFASIAGSGGLTNVAISNYTRDSGWGMGYQVGAIPSMVGAQSLELSHVGKVFLIDRQSLARWKGWVKHVVRDQVAVWMPACFIGVALPSMLSLQFLPRGTKVEGWALAAMTADGVSTHVGEQWGSLLGTVFWYGTLLCGFLVLGPSVASTADGVVRRWVDVWWTSSPKMQSLEPRKIRVVFFGATVVYAIFGLCSLAIGKPEELIVIATNIMNFALGFSCWHTLVVNLTLLPKELRPNWLMRIGLVASGTFFVTLACITSYVQETPILSRFFGSGLP